MTWNDIFLIEENKEYFKNLTKLVDEEYENYTCFPKKDEIFEAFKLTPYENVKVVILGQDPYHEINQAHGLAFSVKCAKLPPSLKNIYKEIKNDLGINHTLNGDLTFLAKQGVLLLNTTLTVREGKANSHEKFGWTTFTDNVISYLNEHENPIVFILWGNNARGKKKLITNQKHLIIESAHPSPLSANRGFFGTKPFSRTNEFLRNNHLSEIDWIGR